MSGMKAMNFFPNLLKLSFKICYSEMYSTKFTKLKLSEVFIKNPSGPGS